MTILKYTFQDSAPLYREPYDQPLAPTLPLAYHTNKLADEYVHITPNNATYKSNQVAI